MAQLRDSSPAKGQGVKATTNTSHRTPATNSKGSDSRGHTKGKVQRTLATRKPKKWGGS